MLAAAASLLNIDVIILDVGKYTPAKQIVASPSHLGHVDGSFSDAGKILELARKVDILTIEIEHVDVNILEDIVNTPDLKLEIHPSPSTIRIIQDKFIQKQHLNKNGLPVADFVEVESSLEGLSKAADTLGVPLMLKSKTLAYDGRGNYVLKDLSKAGEAISALGNRPLYAERLMKLAKEVAVMVVRSTSGEVMSYPVVETVHKENICHLVFAPFRHANPKVITRACRLAEEAVGTFSGAGVFGVELFLLDDG